MFDDMFTFIDPLIAGEEESLFDFIAQAKAFFHDLEEKGQLPPTIQRPLTEETYKEMWMLRYQQHMGQMTFLELLDKYEEILGISPRAQSE